MAKKIKGESAPPRTPKNPGKPVRASRELIDTGRDKRFVRRNPDGTFKESVDVGRSLAADRRSKSKSVAKPGYGDQGDQSKRSTKKSAKKSTKKR